MSGDRAAALAASLCSALCCVMTASCGAPAPAVREAPVAPPAASASAARSTSTPPPAVATDKRITLRYTVNGEDFPSPIVDGMVAGQPTSFLVDTGATHHLVASWLARELATPLERVRGGAADHGGRAIGMSLLPNAGLRVDGWGPVGSQSALVIETGDVLRKLGIGAVLAPQVLAAGGRAVVLDLAGGALREVATVEGRRAFGAAGGPIFAGIRRCEKPGEGTRLIADALVEGHAARLVVDTGATHSSLLAKSAAGQRLVGRARGKSTGVAASGSHTVPMLAGARIDLGQSSMTVDLDLEPAMPSSACENDGYLGMDVLRACALFIGADFVDARCAKPAAE